MLLLNIMLLVTRTLVPCCTCCDQDLLSAGLECIVPYLEPWKGFTMTPPLAGAGGGNVLEVYLQRWPADKKVIGLKHSFFLEAGSIE